MEVVRRIATNARLHPDRTAFRFVGAAGQEHVTNRRLLAGMMGYASALRHANVRRGDLCLIFLPHCPDMLYGFFGAMLEGIIPSYMPCPSIKQDPDIYWSSHAELFAHIAPAAVITSKHHSEQMIANGLGGAGVRFIVLEDVDPEDGPVDVDAGGEERIAFLQHSSGTTGLKKGVALSHRAVTYQVDAYAEMIALGAEDTIVSWLPHYHDMGLIACTVLPLMRGTPVIAIDPFHWVALPQTLFEAMHEHGGTHVWLPNFAFDHLRRTVSRLDVTYDLSRVKLLCNCSEPCKPGTFERFTEAFAKFGVRSDMLGISYAMAETVFAVTQTAVATSPKALAIDSRHLRDGEQVRPVEEGGQFALRLCAVGALLPGMQVKIVDHRGSALPEGHVGEVAVIGACLFDGYFRLDDVTRERMVDGWFLTRDNGFILDGELYIVGRTDDVVIVNGRNFYAHDIEFSVNAIDGVKPGRVVCFGVPNEETGSEEMVVVAEHLDGVPRTALKQEIKRRVFDLMGVMLKQALVVEPGWLVKTTSGKISRKENCRKYLRSRRRRGRSASEQLRSRNAP